MKSVSTFYCYVFNVLYSSLWIQDGALTLPDPSSVDVDLHGIGGVERLVVVEDEDVAAQGVDTG